jgi:hypothetical protein
MVDIAHFPHFNPYAHGTAILLHFESILSANTVDIEHSFHSMLSDTANILLFYLPFGIR